MNIFIEINQRDCAVESRSVDTRNGPRTFHRQTAYLHRDGQAYPDRFAVPVESPDAAYPPGRYQVAPGSYTVGRYGDLEINRFEFALSPMPASAVSEQRKSA